MKTNALPKILVSHYTDDQYICNPFRSRFELYLFESTHRTSATWCEFILQASQASLCIIVLTWIFFPWISTFFILKQNHDSVQKMKLKLKWLVTGGLKKVLLDAMHDTVEQRARQEFSDSFVMKVFVTNPQLDWILPRVVWVPTTPAKKGHTITNPQYKALTDRVKTEYACEVEKYILVNNLSDKLDQGITTSSKSYWPRLPCPFVMLWHFSFRGP